MKKSLLLPLGIMVVGLLGCGGGSSEDKPIAQPKKEIKPTAKITQQDAEFIAPLIYITAKRFPRAILEEDFLENKRIFAPTKENKIREKEEVVNLPDEGVFNCEKGEIEIVYIKGSSTQKYNPQGDVDYKEIYKKCYEDYYTQNGTLENQIKWEKENNITHINHTYLQIGKFSYTKDKNNSLVRTSFTGKANEKATDKNASFTYTTTYDALLTYQNKKYNFNNFKRVQNMKYPFEFNPKETENKINLSGIIDSKEFNGTLIVKTLKQLSFQGLSKCIDGKIEIEAANHTISIVCTTDSLTFYFDKEPLE